MEDLECSYVYYKDGYQMITPSLDYAMQMNTGGDITAHCNDGTKRILKTINTKG